MFYFLHQSNICKLMKNFAGFLFGITDEMEGICQPIRNLQNHVRDFSLMKVDEKNSAKVVT